jgi:hypothetical protein
MARKRHNRLIYQPIVVFIFIFLNCLFTAAPFIQAANFNSHTKNVSGSSLQNQHDPEECNYLNNLDDEQQECHVSFRNNRKVSNTLNAQKAYGSNRRIEKFHVLYPADFSLLIRPQYYSFLSIYYLF